MRSKLLLLVIAVALIFSACGAPDSTTSPTTDTATDAVADAAAAVDVERAATSGADAAFAADEASSASAPITDEVAVANPRQAPPTEGATIDTPIAQQLPDLGRDIIYTAHLQIAATDVAAATARAVQAVEANGGIVFSQDTSGGRSGHSTLVFKVFPEQFQATLADLGSVGTVRGQSINAEDVSALVVDLQSRIATNETSVERLRDLLSDADDVEIVARLEGQLLERETTLERLRGQLRTVRNQVDLATITVTITELLNRPGLSVELVSYAGHDDGFSCFDSARTVSGESGDPLTLCYRVTNVGDTPLFDVAISDDVLAGAAPIAVTGSFDAIEIGQSAVVAFEIEMEKTVRLRSTAAATALDTDENPIAVRANAQALRLDLIEVIDDSPSFGAVLSNSLATLAAIGLWLALTLVAIAPFALVALALYPVLRFAWRWLAARRPAPQTPVKESKGPKVRPAPAAPAAPSADDLVTSDAATAD